MEVSCAGFSEGSAETRVLVLGESWAAGDRLLPELSDALSSVEPSRVCTMGYSGRTAAEILAEFSTEDGLGQASEALGGRADRLLVISGVNDTLQHVGAENYASNVAAIVEFVGAPNAYVVEVPWVSERASSNILRNIKRGLSRYLNDGGSEDVTQAYRDAVAASEANFMIIDYDAFMPEFDASSFQPDGIHLTPEGFKSYGAYLGRAMAL